MSTMQLDELSEFHWSRVKADELDYFVNLAVDECMFWLEAVTRERFVDEEDFLYSIRHGTQLRKLLNLAYPNFLNPETWEFKCDSPAHLWSWPADVSFEVWTSPFLYACWKQLRIPKGRLFAADDLDGDSADLVESEDGKQKLFDRIRRVVCTIEQLAGICERNGIRSLIRFDRSATSPLIDYHDWLLRSEHKRRSHETEDYSPWRSKNYKSKQELAAEGCLILAAEHTGRSSDEGCYSSEDCIVTDLSPTMDTAVDSVTPTDAHPADELAITGSDSTNTVTPAVQLSSSSHTTTTTITDTFTPSKHSSTTPSEVNSRRTSTTTVGGGLYKSTSSSSTTNKNALRFVTPSRSASGLAQAATEQMQIAEEMRRLRAEINAPPQDEADDNRWLSNLDEWRMKRKTSTTAVTGGALPPRMAPEDGGRGEEEQAVPAVVSLRKLSFDHQANKMHKTDVEDFAEVEEAAPLTEDDSSDNNSVDNEARHGTPAPITSPDQRQETLEEHSATGIELLRKMDDSEIRECRLATANFYDSGHFDDSSDNLSHSRDSSFGGGGRHQERQMAPASPPADDAATADHSVTSADSSGFSPGADSGADSLSPRQQHSPKEQDVKVVDASQLDIKGGTGSLYFSTPRPFYTASGGGGTGGVTATPFTKSTLTSHVAPTGDDLDNSSKGVFLPPSAPPPPVALPLVISTDVRDEPTWRKTEPTVTASDEITISIEQKPNAEKGFGFTIKGGQEKKIPIVIESVIAGTPGDRSRLEVGDELVSVNGEDVRLRYHANVTRMIHEALRLGEIELVVRRQRTAGSAKTHHAKPNYSLTNGQDDKPEDEVCKSSPLNTFDTKRSIFEQKTTDPDPYYQFQKQRRHHGATAAAAPGSLNGGGVKRWSSPAMHNPGAGRPPHPAAQPPVIAVAATGGDSKDDASYQTKVGRPGRIENFVPDVEREPGSPKSDYSVTTVSRRRSPGRLTDFIPEVERQANKSDRAKGVIDDSASVGYRVTAKSGGGASVEQPKPLRNYDLGLHDGTSVDGGRSSTESLTSPVRQESVSPAPVAPLSPEQHEPAPTVEKDKDRKLDRIESTRRLKNSLDRARRDFYTRQTAADDGGGAEPMGKFDLYENESSIARPPDEYVDLDMYCRWARERRLYEQAQLLLASPDDQFFFDRPRSFDYESRKRPTASVQRNRSILVVPVRTPPSSSQTSPVPPPTTAVSGDRRRQKLDDQDSSRQRYQVIQQQRLPSPLTPPTSPKQTKSRPFAHIKKDIVFSNEPIPLGLGGGRTTEPQPFTYTPTPPYTAAPVQHETRATPRTTPDQTVAAPPAAAPILRLTTPAQPNTPLPAQNKLPSVHVSCPKPYVPASKLPSPTTHALNAPMSTIAVGRPLVPPSEAPPLIGRHQVLRPDAVSSPPQTTSFQHPTPEPVVINGIHSHKKPALSEKTKTELLYLNLAANAKPPPAESNVDDDLLDGPFAVRGSASPQQQLQQQQAPKRHWLVNEAAAPARLSDQLKSDRLTSPGGGRGSTSPIPPQSTMNGGAGADYENFPPRPSANHHLSNGGVHRSPQSPGQEPILSVSGRHHCSKCTKELGRGAAMIIESLELFYHVDCFRCCVCALSLGSGDRGADVRVRSGRLHCQTCYSNDEAGLKYSEV